MRFKRRTQAERTAKFLQERQDRENTLNKWHVYFCWLPRHLHERTPKDKHGESTWIETREVVWLERVARVSKDSDARPPWVYGPLAYVLTQPYHKRY